MNKARKIFFTKTISICGIVLLFSMVFYPLGASQESKRFNDQMLQQKTWIVDDEGDGDFTSIQEAIEHAQDGDSIQVYSGVFSLTPTAAQNNIRYIPVAVTIIGISQEYGAGTDAGRPSISGASLCIEKSDTTITGFVFSTTLYVGNSDATQLTNITVSKNIFENTRFGIIVWYGEQVSITNNEFYCSENALIIYNLHKDFRITENNFYDTTHFLQNVKYVSFSAYIPNLLHISEVSGFREVFFSNYWNRPSSSNPKIIWGSFSTNWLKLRTFILFDKTPEQEPYPID